MYIQFIDEAAAMQVAIIVALALHVLSGVFWAGTTFVLARTGADQADRFFWPQMGAAGVVVLTGAVLWNLLHRGTLGTPQGHVLAAGAICALAAASIQGATAASMRQKRFAAREPARSEGHRAATGQRIAAAFLAIAVTCM